MVLTIRSQIDFSGSPSRASTRRVNTTGTPGGKEGREDIINKISRFFRTIKVFLFISSLTLICS